MSDSKKAYKNWKVQQGSDIIFPNQVWQAACDWKASAQDGGEPVAWDSPAVDPIVTRLYRKFKEWNQREFTVDDVTWCEVRADVAEMLNATTRPLSAVVPEFAACVSPELHYETQRGLSCKSSTQSAVVPSGVWQFYQDGDWHTGMNNIRDRADTEAAGYKVRDLWVNQEQES
jgi:hypothetical protein